MKKQSEVFEVLKQIVPVDKARRVEEDKETKVTTLRSAISYINSLQQLLEDSEAVRLDSELLRQCALTPSTPGERKKRRTNTKKAARRSSKVMEPRGCSPTSPSPPSSL